MYKLFWNKSLIFINYSLSFLPSFLPSFLLSFLLFFPFFPLSLSTSNHLKVWFENHYILLFFIIWFIPLWIGPLGHDIGRQQPISSHIGSGPAGLLEQFGAKPVAGRCCTVLWELRMWGICQMMSRHMVKHHQTANKIERWWENMRDVQNLIQRLSHKMNQNDKSCAKLWPLFWEIRGVRFLAESHAFQISIYTSSLPGKITRRRTPHPESWSDHFGPFGTYLDYYQRVGLGPTGCQWGFAETCVASHCGWVAGGPQMQGISEKVCGDPLGPKPNSIRKH